MQRFQGFRMVADQTEFTVIKGLFAFNGAAINQARQRPCLFTGGWQCVEVCNPGKDRRQNHLFKPAQTTRIMAEWAGGLGQLNHSGGLLILWHLQPGAQAWGSTKPAGQGRCQQHRCHDRKGPGRQRWRMPVNEGQACRRRGEEQAIVPETEPRTEAAGPVLPLPAHFEIQYSLNHMERVNQHPDGRQCQGRECFEKGIGTEPEQTSESGSSSSQPMVPYGQKSWPEE